MQVEQITDLQTIRLTARSQSWVLKVDGEEASYYTDRLGLSTLVIGGTQGAAQVHRVQAYIPLDIKNPWAGFKKFFQLLVLG